MSFSDVLGVFAWVASLLVPIYLLAWRMPKQDKFILKISLSVVTICVVYFIFALIIKILGRQTTELIMWLHIIKFLSMFLLSAVSVKICFKCDWWGAFFCANAGYCVQHISARLDAVIEELFLKESYLVYKVHWALLMLVSLPIIATVIVLFYLIYIKNIKKNTVFKLTNKSQIFISSFVVSISIFYNTIGISYATGCIIQAEQNGLSTVFGYGSLYFGYIMTMVIAFLALVLNCGMREREQMSGEMDELKRLLDEGKRQYEFEKQNIELINIKCHDLKHQLGAMKGKIYEEQIEELKDVIEIYDSSVKVGNEALDVVLTQKSLYCSQHGIRLTCLLNGKNYDFIPRHELYSMFINVIDNAIEAVEKLPEEKRVISITERTARGFLTIREENYFSGEIELDGGLPVSSKDASEHGFGVKSMKLIAEKYGGGVSVNTDTDKFMLDIYFLQPNNDK